MLFSVVFSRLGDTTSKVQSTHTETRPTDRPTDRQAGSQTPVPHKPKP